MIKKFLFPAILLTLVALFSACGEVDPVAAANDTTAPVVSVTSPADGALLTTDFAITASAVDPESAILKVDFYINNNLIDSVAASGLTTNSVAFSSSMIDLDTLAEGSATIKVVALNGKQLTSEATINVTINKGSQPTNDMTAPVLSITSPASGETITNDFIISSTASDSESGVALVTYYVDGAYHSSTTSPHSGTTYKSGVVQIANLDNGAHTITVVAANGVSLTTTNTVSITVSKSAIVDTISATLGGSEPPIPSNTVGMDVLEPYFTWSNGGVVGALSYRINVFSLTNNQGVMEENICQYWIENVPVDEFSLQYGAVPSGSTIEQSALDLQPGIEYVVNIVALDVADSTGSTDANHIGFSRVRFTVSGTRSVARTAKTVKGLTKAEYLARLQAIREGR